MARIALVDDDLDILAILRLAFEAAGHETVSCPDPLQLPRVLEQLLSPPRLDEPAARG